MSTLDLRLLDALPGALLSDWSDAERTGLLFALARLCGFLAAIPLFSSRILPWRMRAGLAVLMLLALGAGAPEWRGIWSAAESEMPAMAESERLLGGAMELAIGFALGWGSFLVLGAVRAAAVFISDQIGLSLGGVVDPLAEQEEPVLRAFHGALAVFVFVAVDLHHVFVRAVVESFVALPPGSAAAASGWPPALAATLVAAAAGCFEATFVLALPVTLVLLLVSVVQGVLSRALPELELFALGLPLRVGLGIGALALSLPLTTETVHQLFERALDDGGKWLRDLSS